MRWKTVGQEIPKGTTHFTFYDFIKFDTAEGVHYWRDGQWHLVLHGPLIAQPKLTARLKSVQDHPKFIPCY